MNIFDNIGIAAIQVMREPMLSVDEALTHYQKFGVELPKPNVDLSRVRLLKNELSSLNDDALE
jgi:hypothetical protein